MVVVVVVMLSHHSVSLGVSEREVRVFLRVECAGVKRKGNSTHAK